MHQNVRVIFDRALNWIGTNDNVDL
jgi:hypothetical protein